MTTLNKTIAEVGVDNETIDKDRRRLLSAAATGIAVTGVASLFPAHLASAAANDAIRPFRINVPKEDLIDRRKRLAATRWPDRETVNDQSQGVQLPKLQQLVRYWGTSYDWRKVEAKLNALPQFMTNIDGLDIHFIQVRPRLRGCIGRTADAAFSLQPRRRRQRSRCRWPLRYFPRTSIARRRREPGAPTENLTYFHELDRGGHFAREQPELFAAELREAFRSPRQAP